LKPLDELPRYPQDERDVRCPNCECVTEARCWTDDLQAAVGTPSGADAEAKAPSKDA
jgi:ferrochelatase